MFHGIVSGTIVFDGDTMDVEIHKLVTDGPDEWEVFNELDAALKEHFVDAAEDYSFIALVGAESVVSNTHDIPEYDVEYTIREITTYKQLLR